MKIKNTLWYLFLPIFFLGCYEDKGNYDYKDLPIISVKEYITNEADFGTFRNLKMGDIIEAEPVLEFSIGDESNMDLEFEWYYGDPFADDNTLHAIGTGRKLTWEIPVGGNLWMYLVIRDKNSGYECTIATTLRLRVSDASNFGRGWMVLSEIDGQSVFSFLEMNYDEELDEFYYLEMKDLYAQQNDLQMLGGKPVKLMEHWLANSGSSEQEGMVMILQNGGIGPVYVSNRDFKRALYVKDEFMNGNMPNVNFVDVVSNSLGQILLSENGDLYMRAVEDQYVWFAGKFMDMPAQIEGGMKISQLVRTYYQDCFYTLAYDELHHRFLYIKNNDGSWSGSEWGEANVINELQQYPSTLSIDLNNMADIEMIFCGHYMKTREDSEYSGDERCFMMFYKDNRPESDTYGKYCIYTFKGESDESTGELMATPMVEREFPSNFANRINDDGLFYVAPNSVEFLFFTSGANNSELWGYIFRGTGATDPVKLYDFGGKKITCMVSSVTGGGHSSAGMDLAIGLDSGEIYEFTVNNSHFANGNINYNWKSTNTYGKIVYMRYKNMAGHAM